MTDLLEATVAPRLPELRSVLVIDEDEIGGVLRDGRATVAAMALRARSMGVDADALEAEVEEGIGDVDPEAAERRVVEMVDELLDELEARRAALAVELERVREDADLEIALARVEAAAVLARSSASLETLVRSYASGVAIGPEGPEPESESEPESASSSGVATEASVELGSDATDVPENAIDASEPDGSDEPLAAPPVVPEPVIDAPMDESVGSIAETDVPPYVALLVPTSSGAPAPMVIPSHVLQPVTMATPMTTPFHAMSPTAPRKGFVRRLLHADVILPFLAMLIVAVVLYVWAV